MVITPNSAAIRPDFVGKNIGARCASIIIMRIKEGKKNRVALIVNGVAPPE
jgi:pyrimidine operon attenuation protein/uracil phosphoribosyltransferase